MGKKKVKSKAVVEEESVPAEQPVVEEKPKKKLNGYFQAMLEAKKNDADSFEYKGSKYVKGHTKNGMIVYKKQKDE